MHSSTYPSSFHAFVFPLYTSENSKLVSVKRLSAECIRLIMRVNSIKLPFFVLGFQQTTTFLFLTDTYHFSRWLSKKPKLPVASVLNRFLTVQAHLSGHVSAALDGEAVNGRYSDRAGAVGPLIKSSPSLSLCSHSAPRPALISLSLSLSLSSPLCSWTPAATCAVEAPPPPCLPGMTGIRAQRMSATSQAWTWLFG